MDLDGIVKNEICTSDVECCLSEIKTESFFNEDTLIKTEIFEGETEYQPQDTEVEFQEFVETHLTDLKSSLSKGTQTTQFSFATLSNENIQFLTSFSVFELQNVYARLRFDRTHITSNMDQLIIVLSVYKHKLPFGLISTLFKITEMEAQRIFYFWTHILYNHLRGVNFWMDAVPSPVKYAAIFNCVEIPVERSEEAEHRQLTQSHNKSGFTFKCLVVTDEDSTIVFCSDLYGGDTSGRQIVVASGVLSYLKPGDVILTDREFIIYDILEDMNVGQDVALFVNRESKLDLVRAYRIARSYDILNKTMEKSFWPLANRIAYNCLMLSNFHKLMDERRGHTTHSSALSTVRWMNFYNKKN